MIDLGLSKLAIIGVIALVVIGPERLPKVARTVGTLLGRAQRYVADVKAEVSREMDLEELRKMGNTVRDAAQNFESSVRTEIDKTESELNASLAAVKEEAASALDPFGSGGADSGAAVWLGTDPPRRKDWKKRQHATPLWYRNANRKRSHVTSGAARVARHRYKPQA